MAKSRTVKIKLGFDTAQARRDLREVDRDLSGISRTAGRVGDDRGRPPGRQSKTRGYGDVAASYAGNLAAIGTAGLVGAASGSLAEAGVLERLQQSIDYLGRNILQAVGVDPTGARQAAINQLAGIAEQRGRAGLPAMSEDRIATALDRLEEIIRRGAERRQAILGMGPQSDVAEVGGFFRDMFRQLSRNLRFGFGIDGAAVSDGGGGTNW